MINLLPITLVVLTKNEELHIERLILNVVNKFNQVILIDSFSSDNTIKIANQYGVMVIQNQFKDFSQQRNFAIKSNLLNNNWIFFLDADEIIDNDLFDELHTIFSKEIKFDGFYINRKFFFMNKWIKYGGYYPTYLLRLFNKDKAQCNGIVNEHIKINGSTSILKNGHIIDRNLNNFNFWVKKHNIYSDLEAIIFDNVSYKSENLSKSILSQAALKNYFKVNLFNKIPLFFRSFAYFIYRYIFRLGFLDGYVGFIYHFCQGFIFWFFVDVKILELKNNKRNIKL